MSLNNSNKDVIKVEITLPSPSTVETVFPSASCVIPLWKIFLKCNRRNAKYALIYMYFIHTGCDYMLHCPYLTRTLKTNPSFIHVIATAPPAMLLPLFLQPCYSHCFSNQCSHKNLLFWHVLILFSITSTMSNLYMPPICLLISIVVCQFLASIYLTSGKKCDMRQTTDINKLCL